MLKIFSKINSNILCVAFFACTVCFCGYAEVYAAQNPVQTEMLYRVKVTNKRVADFVYTTHSKSTFSCFTNFSFSTFMTSERNILQVLILYQNELFLNNIFRTINTQTLVSHSYRDVDPLIFS